MHGKENQTSQELQRIWNRDLSGYQKNQRQEMSVSFQISMLF